MDEPACLDPPDGAGRAGRAAGVVVRDAVDSAGCSRRLAPRFREAGRQDQHSVPPAEGRLARRAIDECHPCRRQAPWTAGCAGPRLRQAASEQRQRQLATPKIPGGFLMEVKVLALTALALGAAAPAWAHHSFAKI